jgi:hypothetical protein
MPRNKTFLHESTLGLKMIQTDGELHNIILDSIHQRNNLVPS